MNRRPRVVRGLLRVAWYELRNTIWPPSTRRRLYRIGAAALGVALWAAIFAGLCAGVLTLTARFPGIEAVLPRAVELFVVVLFFTLVYSGVIVTLGRVYLADSLRLVGALPAAPRRLFWSYWLQVVGAAGWMPLAFGSAALAGIGAAVGVAPSWYVVLAAGFVTFVVASVTLSVILTTAIASALPASRARDIVVALSLIVLVGLFIAVRSLRPERLGERGAAQRLAESLLEVEAPGAGWLPSSYFADALTPALLGGQPGWGGLGLLIASAVALALLGYLVFGWAFPLARSRALSSRGQGVRAPSTVSLAVWWITRPLPRAVRAIARKDMMHLSRDATQWSQLLLLLGLSVIYLFNMSALPIEDARQIGATREAVADWIAVFNLIPAGFVLAAVALRFVYAAISLEGRAAWIALSAPSGIGALVAAKIVVGLPILMVLGVALSLGTSAIVGASVGVSTLSVVGVVLVAVAFSGLAAGLGVMQPSFRADHPTQVVTSLGGFVFMGVAVLFAVLFTAAWAPAGWMLHARGSGAATADALSWMAVGLAALGVLGAAATAVVPLILGISRLDARQLEP